MTSDPQRSGGQQAHLACPLMLWWVDLRRNQFVSFDPSLPDCSGYVWHSGRLQYQNIHRKQIPLVLPSWNQQQVCPPKRMTVSYKFCTSNMCMNECTANDLKNFTGPASLQTSMRISSVAPKGRLPTAQKSTSQDCAIRNSSISRIHKASSY